MSSSSGNQIIASADILCEFLEAAIHHLLCMRGIYPPELFQRGRLYDIPVQKSRHPELNAYIANLVLSLRKWMSKGAGLSKVIILVSNSEHQPLERFIFNFKLANPEDETAPGGLPLDFIERTLSAFITKLSLSHCVLQPLPSDCKWEVIAASVASGPPEADIPGEPPVWLEETLPDGGFQFNEEEFRSPSLNIPSPVIVPMKALTCNSFHVQLHVEVPEGRQA